MNVSNIKFVIIVFLVTTFTPVALIADSEISKEDTIQFLHKIVLNSVADLGKKIRICTDQKKAVLLDKEILKTFEVTRSMLLSSILHLNIQNDYKCEKSSRLKLAYDLGTLQLFYKHYQMDIEAIEGVNSELIFPSETVIELSIKYSKTPEELKKYLKSVIGDNPFDLIKTMEINNFTRMK